LKYHREDNGCVLYSIGPNFIDDGGKGDLNTDIDCDDLVIRFKQ